MLVYTDATKNIHEGIYRGVLPQLICNNKFVVGISHS